MKNSDCCTIISYEDLPDDLTRCPITLENFQKNQKIFKTKCGHIFGKKAFLKWIKTHNTCPTCRIELYEAKPSRTTDHSSSDINFTIEFMIMPPYLERLSDELEDTSNSCPLDYFGISYETYERILFVVGLLAAFILGYHIGSNK